MTDCPCGSGLDYAVCCEPCIRGVSPAATAVALMRSRYTAYVKNEIPYLGETLHPQHRSDWDEDATRRWSENAEWKSLEVLGTQAGEADDDEGLVEFLAVFNEDNVDKRHHETSRFRKHKDRWYYVDGELPKPKTQRNETPKVGRNDPCPCGSGKKYKKCCGR